MAGKVFDFGGATASVKFATGWTDLGQITDLKITPSKPIARDWTDSQVYEPMNVTGKMTIFGMNVVTSPYVAPNTVMRIDNPDGILIVAAPDVDIDLLKERAYRFLYEKPGMVPDVNVDGQIESMSMVPLVSPELKGFTGVYKPPVEDLLASPGVEAREV